MNLILVEYTTVEFFYSSVSLVEGMEDHVGGKHTAISTCFYKANKNGLSFRIALLKVPMLSIIGLYTSATLLYNQIQDVCSLYLLPLWGQNTKIVYALVFVLVSLHE